MITKISVKNIALIESATLKLSPGLNAITGETGAGKTLLATSLQLLLGGRARSGTVRSGSGRATVEGSFILPEENRSELLFETLGDLAEELEAEEEIVLRRTVSEDGGRSRCFVNGVTVPVKALAALGERLVSYHSQREQTRLTDPNEQLAILDGFLNKKELAVRDGLAATYHEVRKLREKLDDIRSSSESRLREADFLRFQVDEIETADFSSEEFSDLTRERDRLRNVTGLREALASASEALSSETGETGGAVEAVGRAASEVESAASQDNSLSPLAGRLSGAATEIEDILYELRAYAEELEADPARLDTVEDRLAEIRALQRKYGDDVLAYLEDARAKLARLDNTGEETADLERRLEGAEKSLEDLSAKLSKARERASGVLAKKVRKNLEDLNLGSTVFKANLLPTEKAGPSGAERVEFAIQPNPGEPELPVRKYASGGELSRVMLAVRLAQESLDPGATYIFDEVDAGIGGATATAVGAKLNELGKRNQVLTITHLPQIASEASAHIIVSKGDSSGRTTTDIRTISGDERTRELARMLSGRVDEASLAHASELLVGDG
ncbi:DNA repair protein RecN [Rubrobacter indicoceani]|uniref:DNA repair protein RecN n=1 Tax=Rubrobacter indicoceani TaxID=2051957 RepID=UPI000E5AB71D|nr:DNA repair protein RecN [Rubrobacter indicoceani]